MKTVTVEILNEKAYRLLEDLEELDVIKLQRPSVSTGGTGISKLRGSIQLHKTVEEIDEELRNLRAEWERDFS